MSIEIVEVLVPQPIQIVEVTTPYYIAPFDRDVIDPYRQFGVIGDADGRVDDGDAIIAMLAYMRATLTNSGDAYKYYQCNFGGRRLYSTKSLNYGGFPLGLNISFANGIFTGNCPGKAVFDFIGTRGAMLREMHIANPSDVSARTGVQWGRPSTGANADFNHMVNSNVDGYFDLAAYHNYSSELGKHRGCRFFNRKCDAGAYSFIVQSHGTKPLTSDYYIPATDIWPMTQTEFFGCQFMRIPDNFARPIVAITNEIVAHLTLAPGHGLVNGSVIWFEPIQINGMIEIRGKRAVLANRSGDTFTIGIDTSGFGVYSGGGWVAEETGPIGYIEGPVNLVFDDACYGACYNIHAMEYGATDNIPMARVGNIPKLEGIFDHNVKFLVGSAPIRSFFELKFQDHTVWSTKSYFTSDASNGAIIRLPEIDISTKNPKFINSEWKIFDNPANFLIRSAGRIRIDQKAGLNDPFAFNSNGFVGEETADDRVPATIRYYDRGFASEASLNAGVTLDALLGDVITASLTTAAGADYFIAVNNVYCTGVNDVSVTAWVIGGSTALGKACVTRVVPQTGKFQVRITNLDPLAALAGTVRFQYEMKIGRN